MKQENEAIPHAHGAPTLPLYRRVGLGFFHSLGVIPARARLD